MPTWNEMMYWDCPNCGTSAIEGINDHCPTCGDAHDVDEAPWYAKGEGSYANRITNHEHNVMAEAGANWKCAYCEGTQRRPDGNCLNCAGPQTAGRSEGTPKRRSNPNPAPRTERPSRRPRSQRSAAPHRPRVTTNRTWNTHSRSKSKMSESPSRLKKIGIASLILLAMTSLGWVLFHKRPVTVQVTGVKWSHQVNVERKVKVSDTGFDENMPSRDPSAQRTGRINKAFNVRIIDSHRFHHTEQVPDGYRTEHYTEREACGTETVGKTSVSCSTNNNGTRTCSGGDPITRTKYCNVQKTREVRKYRDVDHYETWYGWNEWKWRLNRSPTHSGNTLETSWPTEKELCLNCQTNGLEEERVSRKISQYEVSFVDMENESYTIDPDTLSEFNRYPIGSKHECEYSIAGGVDCQFNDQQASR